ncbi:MAG: CoB--CoM heterodisulfide reductase iron-sulfur subunit A family protein [Deltaproteobacteria bacterium]|nr:CoB--CoM heterodisulfide reductase iron-sulfur subunit A family protein [Deltaproteobacteria bacterium]
MRTAVFFCQVGDTSPLNVDSVAKYASNLPGVEHVEVLGVRPPLDPPRIAERIRTVRIDRIIIAGDQPGFFKPAFTRAMDLATRSPQEVFLAPFEAWGAPGEDAEERAKAIVACACRGVPFTLAAIPAKTPVHPATLVIGGGVAGIQAALEIADAGKQVHLVERTATLGGHMAMFDKTFPTLDCAACILTPKMVSVGQHPMIDLITYAEVEEVSGSPGAYKVRIRRRARRVDVSACVACGICAEVCPVRVPSEFDAGIATRKAVYVPFPQAVPNAYVVDGDACTWVQTNGQKCGACARKCPKACIDLGEQDRVEELEVGSIIVSTGYEVFDAKRIDRYGYGVLPNVLTALEFERLTNASGPTGGRIVTRTKQYDKRTKQDVWVFQPDGPSPRSVAIIHCVGSRDSAYNPYCSRVCCMYSLKFAHLVREKLPEAACFEFYIDMRAFGKGYEEFAERIKAEGTHVVRGRTASVQMVGEEMVVRGEDILQDRLLEFPVDMVILAVGLVPATGTEELAHRLGIQRDPDGWYAEFDYDGNPTETQRGGVYVAGMCQGPKDIPDTVAQASAVAAGVLRSISSGRGSGHLASLTLSQIEARAKTLSRPT